ncbi:MAG: 3-oxoacyl-ACP synthase III [Halobacteriovoraceae bacterium]|nr:3-oxoacyl-ACP synthase III [Halobacteriovoraceae bacterium]
MITGISLLDIQHYLPENILTSEEIEFKLENVYQKLKLPHGRLELMTGIKERRFWPNGTLPSKISTQAAKPIIEKFGAQQIDYIIHASVCRDFLEPATASVVHQNLGLSQNCQFLDLSNACLGVLNAIILASSLIKNKAARNILIVSGENGYPLLDHTIKTILNDPNLTRKNIKKYIANLTIGSAGVALLLGPTEQYPQCPQFTAYSQLTDSSANDLCRGDGNTHSLMMETNSEMLMEKGVALAKKNFKLFLETSKIKLSDLNFYIGHQVGSAHHLAIEHNLNLEGIRHHITYDTLGNTGSAALPVTLSISNQLNMLKKGNLLALLGIGSGLSSIIVGLRW